MKLTRRSVVITGLLTVALGLTGCGSNSAMPEVQTGNEELDQLIVDAQEEGEVIWYQVPDTKTAEAVGAAFDEKYGITATFARTTSADLEQRFTAEQESGAPSADVILPLAGSFFDKTVSEEWVLPLEEADIPGDPGAELQNDEIEDTVAFSAQTYGWAVNTDLVPVGERPQSWDDLLDPKWKGKIIIPDPEASANYIAYWSLVTESQGEDYLPKLKEQIGRVHASSTGLTQALAAGEASIALTAVTAATDPVAEEGAPIEFMPSDPGIVAPTVVGVSADAEHPNAARLFVHYLLSEEGQAAFNEPAGVTTMAEAEGTISNADLQEEANQQRDDVLQALGL